MLLDKNMANNFSENKSRVRLTENNKDKKLRAFTNWTKKVCPEFFFVWTKGHLPPSRIFPA